KMHSKNIPFDQIYDIYALRIIFENDDESLEKLRCWQIYTYVTDGNPPHPDRLRDWISTPKANGYSALHVTVMGPDGRWVEVQIRSRKMDEIAELGYAAHWKYKTGEYSDGAELESWMNTIKDILASPDPDGVDVLDTIKLNLYSPEIYVFTPRGDLKTLPSGSTVLDFAFEVHTDLGMQCVAGKINHKLVPLSHVLDSGDQIEIITSRTRRPAPEWLRFCRTAKAKSAIRALYQQNYGSTGADSNTIAFKLFIEGTDRIGMLASITHRLSQIMRSDIRQLESSASDGKFSCTATVARIPDNNPEKLCSSLLEIDGVDSAHFTNI
ncbi:MAG: TGS domain-containing protein, partial [Muribaculaceae bacterium]|nr:TGS domain-containing protein [Muribaculaceae bacterium]